MGLSRPPIERLMEKVEKRESGCWEWTQYLDSDGYARIWVDCRNVPAHRFSYEYHVGPIPAGLVIDHLCRVRNCVNPDHLEPVTPATNTQRGILADVIRQRWHSMQHCPNGHPYDEENTRPTPTGRACRECKRQSSRDYYARNRELVIERARLWQLANPEAARASGRKSQAKYRLKNKNEVA